MMSPRNIVSLLRHLCLKIISNQLIYALSDDEGKYYQVVEKYLSGATYEVLQDLLNIILNCVNLDASIRFSCLELLLGGDVKKLDTGMFPQFYYEKILNVIANNGKKLEHLNLKGVWVRDYPQQLCEVVKNCGNVRTLVIPHMASDEVLQCINDLKKLLVLDICGEGSFSASGIKHFKSEVLRVLDVGNFGKTDICQEANSGAELVAILLENLPNIEHLRTYSFTGKALQKLNEKRPHRKTKLKYLHDTGTSIDTVECIVMMCPNLESIHLDSPSEGVVKKLSELTKLNTLKLTKSDVDEIFAFLRCAGSQIQVLTLNNARSRSLDLSEVCVHVAGLLKLECYKMNLCFYNLENYFMCLETVELLYCDMSDNVVKCILTNAPFLKRFLVGSIINMTDGDIFRICAESDLGCLEELWFSYARSLTATTVELLMGHCPNLKVLGQLDRWGVSQEDLDLFRIAIVLTNTDLSLLPDEVNKI